MSPEAPCKGSFHDQLGLPEACRLDKRIFKRMVLEHGHLTASDKRILADDVSQLTWKYALKASTVPVLPYEDGEREYLEVAVVEVLLSSRNRSQRIAEIVQRAIPYPVLLILVEEDGLCVSVADKRFSLADKGRIVAVGFLCSPWIEQPEPGRAGTDLDQEFFEALAFDNLSQVDFHALYRGIVRAVLARLCAEFTGRFVLEAGQSEQERRRRLEQCYELEREMGTLRAAIPKENRFSEQVEQNTRIQELTAQLAHIKARL